MGAKLRNFIALCYNGKSVFVHKNVRKDAKKGVRCWGNGFFYYICNDTLRCTSVGKGWLKGYIAGNVCKICTVNRCPNKSK